jgi:hypothetical protein
MKTENIGFWAIAAVMANLLAAPVANAQTERFSASLGGENEVPPINTGGTAAFEMTIQDTITFSLTFSGLSSPLTVAHLHFAPSKVAGGVMIFLCGGGNQPACPAATEGTITGTITAANVTGPGGQGITPGDLDSALEAVRGTIYPMRTCTPRISPGVRFAARFSGARDMIKVVSDSRNA